MASLSLRTKVITEINLFPEDKLAELYFIYYIYNYSLEGAVPSDNAPQNLRPTMSYTYVLPKSPKCAIAIPYSICRFLP
ncbi:MAG: hypothetical protein HEQ10_18510 [Dolichospermum sp. DEX182a]|nr:hypothetical protein [Dolichospermum sp. DEX182a]